MPFMQKHVHFPEESCFIHHIFMGTNLLNMSEISSKSLQYKVFADSVKIDIIKSLFQQKHAHV